MSSSAPTLLDRILAVILGVPAIFAIVWIAILSMSLLERGLDLGLLESGLITGMMGISIALVVFLAVLLAAAALWNGLGLYRGRLNSYYWSALLYLLLAVQFRLEDVMQWRITIPLSFVVSLTTEAVHLGVNLLPLAAAIHLYVRWKKLRIEKALHAQSTHHISRRTSSCKPL